MTKKTTKYFLILTVIMFVNSVFGQLTQKTKDSKCEKIAKDYLYKSLGKDFVKENILFLGIYHAGLTVAVFEASPTKNIDGRNTFFIYFKYQKDEIDTLRTRIDKNEIIKSINGETCNLLIGIDKAKEIAEKTGLKKGIEPYEIGLVHLGEKQIPKWDINSIYMGSRKGSYATGESVLVNMTDGKAELSFWSMME